jgi:hypothetical protein
LDEGPIARSTLVLDWKGFTDAIASAVCPAGVETDEARAALLRTRPDVDRPSIVAGLLKVRLAAERAQGASEEVVRQRVANYAATLLDGFQIVNTSARDFRLGDLPSDRNEFSDMTIDTTLAACLVRKVAG